MAKMDYSKRNRQDAVTRSMVRHISGAPKIIDMTARRTAGTCHLCTLPLREGQRIRKVGNGPWQHTYHHLT